MADGKWIPGLTPDLSVSEAARRVLTVRFAVVREYLPLAAQKPDEDREYVHQLRVGTRRAAAALRVFKPCLPRKLRATVRDSLRTLRRAAGEARDWDVFLTGLPQFKPLATPAGKPAFDFLAGYALGQRAAVQGQLVQAAETAGPHFAETGTALVHQVHEPRGDDPPARLGDLAAQQLGELLHALTTAAAANPTEPGPLHQLRILAKRVRYALEIFADCFPPVFKDTVYGAVEHVQELLGEVQDATVGLAQLAALRERVKAAISGEWPRLQRGFEGVMHSLRAKVPAGRKAFQKWRQQWAELMDGLKLELVTTTVTAPATA
jgi:CHAD domain-containing protein